MTRPLPCESSAFRVSLHHERRGDIVADATQATFQRDDFDVSYGKENGFFMYVNLQLTVEAQRVDPES